MTKTTIGAVDQCPQCGALGHRDLEIRELSRAVLGYTKWTQCPATGDPILIDPLNGGVHHGRQPLDLRRTGGIRVGDTVRNEFSATPDYCSGRVVRIWTSIEIGVRLEYQRADGTLGQDDIAAVRLIASPGPGDGKLSCEDLGEFEQRPHGSM